MGASAVGATERWTAVTLRTTAVFAALGGVLAAIAGTVDWPVVGTFFDALSGTVAGAVVGLAASPVLVVVACLTRSRWALRAAAGLTAAAAGAGVALLDGGVPELPHALPIILAVAGVAVAGAVAPLLVHGAVPVAGRPAAELVVRVGGRILVWGLALGAGGGAVAGLLIGLHVHPLTAPFAAVEGSVLGLVSGGALATALAGLVVLPRLRARR